MGSNGETGSTNGNGEDSQQVCEVAHWDDYFLLLAVTASLKSKDRRNQVGAVIVSQDNVVLSTGFNGFPRGIFDDERLLKDPEKAEACVERTKGTIGAKCNKSKNREDFKKPEDWEGDEDYKAKLALMCHAESNAVINAARTGVCLKGSTIYVNKFPCLSCCNIIVQVGIARLYTHDKWFWDKDPLDGKDQTNHDLKRSVLKQAPIQVDAPYHPEYKVWGPIRDYTHLGSLRCANMPDLGGREAGN